MKYNINMFTHEITERIGARRQLGWTAADSLEEAQEIVEKLSQADKKLEEEYAKESKKRSAEFINTKEV